MKSTGAVARFVARQGTIRVAHLTGFFVAHERTDHGRGAAKYGEPWSDCRAAARYRLISWVH